MFRSILASILRRLGLSRPASQSETGQTPSPDRLALDNLGAVSNMRAIHVVENYLYLPDQQTAGTVAEMLCERGFTIQRIGAYGDDWLLLAETRIVPTEAEIAKMRAMLEQIVADHEGYYDGWDADSQA